MSAELLDFKTDRDASLKLIDWFDVERVHGARILVVGAGAIGNEVLKNLALLGVGNVFVYDRDTIEMSNLSRSVLFRASDAGRLKAETAARAVRELNPNVSVRWEAGDVTADLGLGEIRRTDVVIGCLDNRDARLALNRACWKVGTPWIDAGIGQLNGQVRSYRPGHGACYECAYTDEDYRQVAVPCGALASRYAAEGKTPTTPTIASIVAGVQVQEALKLLTPERWEGRLMAGREFVFNGTVGAAGFVDLPERADCLAHHRFEDDDIVQVPYASAAATTAAELLGWAREWVGVDAVLELNFELAVGARCPGCGTATPLLRPIRKVFREDVTCERCDVVGEVVTTHTLGGPFADAGPLLGLTLGEIGVPRLDIIEARGANGQSLYLELTGDAEEGVRGQGSGVSSNNTIE